MYDRCALQVHLFKHKIHAKQTSKNEYNLIKVE